MGEKRDPGDIGEELLRELEVKINPSKTRRLDKWLRRK